MIIDDFRKVGNVPSSKLLLIIIARGFAISWLIPLINSIFLRFFFRSDRVCVKSSADIGFNENEDKGGREARGNMEAGGQRWEASLETHKGSADMAFYGTYPCVSSFQFSVSSDRFSVSSFWFPNVSFQCSVSSFQFQIAVSRFKFPELSFQVAVSSF